MIPASIRNLALVILFSATGMAAAGAAGQCEPAKTQAAERAVTASRSWSEVFRAYSEYAACDSGRVASAFTESMTFLLSGSATEWNEIVRLAGSDKGFWSFVVRHIDQTVVPAVLDEIERNAEGRNCTPEALPLCGTVFRAAREVRRKSAKCLEPKRGGPEGVVRALYARFPFDGREAVWHASRDVLAKYFDQDLTKLLVREHECNVATKEICNLDADVLHDAQDAEITELQVCALDQESSTIAAWFKNFGAWNVVRYRMTNTAAGWRVSDILYQRGGSLRAGLSQ